MAFVSINTKLMFEWGFRVWSKGCEQGFEQFASAWLIRPIVTFLGPHSSPSTFLFKVRKFNRLNPNKPWWSPFKGPSHMS